jgi:hypothetical protein
MPFIRQHYLFPPRAWRRQSLPCNGAAGQIRLGDVVPGARSAFSAHAALYLVRELNGGGIVPNSWQNPYGSKQC